MPRGILRLRSVVGRMRVCLLLPAALLTLPLHAAPRAVRFDILIKGGTVYDGSGGPGALADVGIRGDRVAAVGDLSKATAGTTLDAAGMAVAPGFINMLSWSTESGALSGRALAGPDRVATTH